MTDPKNALDVASVGVVLGGIAGWLPVIAAALSVVWFGIRIYEYIVWRKNGRNDRFKM